MTQPNLDRLIWCDLETFGLDPIDCPVVEVGFSVTDLELNLIDDFQVTIWSSPVFDERLVRLARDDKYVFDMHDKSGLWEDAQRDGRHPDDALDYMMSFLQGMGVSKDEPICGSSVQFDRAMLAAQYPAVEALFSYRNIDVSTVKELCMRYNPRVYAGLADATQQKKSHRVLPDLDDTKAEFEFYKDNFLFI